MSTVDLTKLSTVARLVGYPLSLIAEIEAKEKAAEPVVLGVAHTNICQICEEPFADGIPCACEERGFHTLNPTD